MRTGLSIYSLWNAFRKGDMTIEEGFAFMQSLGCESVEIANFVVPLHDIKFGPFAWAPYDPDLEKKLVDYAARYEVPIGAYSCGSDIGRLKGDKYKEMLEFLYSEIDLAHRLGAPLIRIDLVMVMMGKDDVGIDAFDRMFDQCVDSARLLADYAKQYDMIVTVENHGTMMNGGDRVGKLVRAVGRENYGVTLDIGNTVCVDEDPLICATELIPYAREIHVKDFYIRRDPYVIGAKYKDGYAIGDPSVLGNGSWLTTKYKNFLRGAIVGHGDLPIKELLALVKNSGFDGDMLVEFEGMEEPRLASQISLSNLRQILSMV
ncbi:MAG: sugar phosphate isomerase/epimerase [Firmicutes bacterium]|nr:sugar phosphate isomerase/epimerase [Bacillota bacterium]